MNLRREMGMLVSLVAIAAAIWASNANFAGVSNVLDITRQVGMLGILTLGTSYVIMTGGIDLSIGSIVGLTGVIVAKLSSHDGDCLGYPIWVGITVALGIALLIGLIQGLLITRLDLQPFIVTLAFMLIVRGASQIVVNNGTLSLGDIPFRKLADGGWFTVHGDPLLQYPLLIFILCIIVGGYLLHCTVFGRYVYAIGGNRDAAAYSGIAVRRVETMTYVISGGMAGLAGLCYAAFTGQMSQQLGISYELNAIAAAVVGGVSLRGGEGTIIGIIIGTAIMQVIQNGIDFFQWQWGGELHKLGPQYQNVITGGVILIAVILDQVVHIVQARRRTRKAGGGGGAGDSGVPKETGFETAPVGAQAAGETARSASPG